MLTFFRRIRKGLLNIGAARKSTSPSGQYLLYAIGEIALVVIGILIALQINNWNEWREDRRKEVAILHALANNLERNCVILENSIELINNFNRSSAIVFDLLNKRRLYSDSLSQHFEIAGRNGALAGLVSRDGYESYKNAGFDILRSESLKKNVLSLFEVLYGNAEKLRELLVGRVSNNRSTFYSKHFRDYKPINYNGLIESNELYEWFRSQQEMRNLYREQILICYKESQRILQLIKNELEI